MEISLMFVMFNCVLYDIRACVGWLVMLDFPQFDTVIKKGISKKGGIKLVRRNPKLGANTF
jgi:hypothetical protein